MSFCTICGKSNDDAAKFCTGCGGALTGIQQTVQSKINLKFIIISLTALSGIIACYFIFIYKKSNADTTTGIKTDTIVTQQPPSPTRRCRAPVG